MPEVPSLLLTSLETIAGRIELCSSLEGLPEELVVALWKVGHSIAASSGERFLRTIETTLAGSCGTVTHLRSRQAFDFVNIIP